MRKLSKIFALLLTVCLLIGAVSVFASAATLNASELESGSTGITNAISYSYENGLYNSLNPYDTTGTKYCTSITSSQSGSSVIASAMASETVGDETNHYWRYVWGGATYNKYVEFSHAAKSTYAAPNYKYLVFDADFTTDAYLNADGTDIDAEATSGKLAYPEGGGFGFRGNVSSVYITCAFLVSDGDDWYVANAESLANATASVKLDGGISEWNHITYVFDTAGTYYVYINGAYAWSGTCVASDSNAIATTNAYFRVTTSTKRNFAFCVDNVTSNLYTSEYASSDSVYGLDDFLAVDYMSNIGAVEDIVGNNNNSSNVALPENNFKVGSTEYALLSSALGAVEEGGEITAYSSFTLPSVFGPKKFTVVCENGAEMTLEGEALTGYIVEEVTDGEKTTYTLIVDPKYGLEGIDEYIYYDYNSGDKLAAFNTTFSNNFTAGNATYNGNGYATITVKEGITSTPITNAIAYTAEKSSTTTELVKQYDRYVVEFDLATGSNYFEGMYISIFSNTPSGAYYDLGYLVSNEGKWYFANASTYADATNTYALPETAGEWTHFTLMGYDDGTNYGIDVYINGEYFTTQTAKTGFRMERLCMRFPEYSAISSAEGREVRLDNVSAIGYGTEAKAYDSGEELFGIDDYIALGDKTLPLTFVEDIEYNYLFKFETPNTPAVNIGTGDYYNLAAAFKELKDGDTITLTEDVILYAPLNAGIKTLNVEGADIILEGSAALLYSYDNGVLAKSVIYTAVWTDGTNTVASQQLPVDTCPDPTTLVAVFDGIKGNYKNVNAWEIAIGASEEYTLLSEVVWSALEDGDTVTLRPITGTVSWYELDGTTQNGETETWFVGTVEPKSFESLAAIEALNNGWYEWEYKYWNSADEDYALTAGEQKSFVAVKGLVSAIDAMYNYALGSQYYTTLYLPEAPENVTVTSVVTVSASTKVESDGEAITIGGKNYIKYTGIALSVYSWYPVSKFDVSFTVEIDGEEIALNSKTFEFKISDYMSKVLATYDCGSPEETLIVNWLQYLTQSYGLYNSALNYGLLSAISGDTGVLTTHFKNNPDCESNMKSMSAQLPEAADDSLTYRNFASLGTGFGATYSVGASVVRLGMYVPVEYADANPELSITASLKGIANGKTAQNISFALELYTIKEIQEIEGVETEVVLPAITQINGVDCYLYVSPLNAIAMYNVNEVVTLTLSLGEEVQASGTYSIAEYLYNINGTLTEEISAGQQAVLNVIESLIAFGKASREYMVYGTEAAN